MIGLGTLINSVSIVAGGLIGQLVGKLFKTEQQEALNKACGVSVLFIAIAGAMEGMLQIDGAEITSGKSMLVVLCLALGTMIGELIGSTLIFCIGINLVWGKKLKVANMLPAVSLAILAAYLPWSF